MPKYEIDSGSYTVNKKYGDYSSLQEYCTMATVIRDIDEGKMSIRRSGMDNMYITVAPLINKLINIQSALNPFGIQIDSLTAQQLAEVKYGNVGRVSFDQNVMNKIDGFDDTQTIQRENSGWPEEFSCLYTKEITHGVVICIASIGQDDNGDDIVNYASLAHAGINSDNTIRLTDDQWNELLFMDFEIAQESLWGCIAINQIYISRNNAETVAGSILQKLSLNGITTEKITIYYSCGGECCNSVSFAITSNGMFGETVSY